MMRPQAAIWFEILAAKDDATRIAETLAAAGCAEFEPPDGGAPQAADAERTRLREHFHEIERRYRAWWPAVALPAPRAFPTTALARALARIETWAAAAAPQIATVEAAESELDALGRWQALLAVPELGVEQRAALAPGGGLAAALLACAGGAEAQLPDRVLATTFRVGADVCLFAIGSPAVLAELEEQVKGLGGAKVELPHWFGAPGAAQRVEARAARCREIVRGTRERLDLLAREHRLAEAVADARCGCWCLDNVAAIEERPALCRVTGWTGDLQTLRAALEAAGLRALLRFSAPPPGLQPPLMLHNPWWARPYETFCRLLGMPAGDAADPSAVVALVFPLLFGYMFGDVGQGLVLTAAGLAAGRRWPLARLFIPAGLSAAVFGVAFGSMFSLQGIIPALWRDPLDEPLPVLLLPVFGGAALLLAGFALAGVEARWRGEFAAWLRGEGGAVALYVALLAAAATRGDALAPALATALALALALALLQGGGAVAVLSAFAASLEKTLQLAINTVSFVRVGAFAIAHAGLSAALGLLAEGAGDGAAAMLVVVLGNAFIVALEVLVVSIQTTRLLLFEFFTRFFVGSGRAFRPAAPPALDVPEVRREA